jgi:hypothetical protein
VGLGQQHTHLTLPETFHSYINYEVFGKQTERAFTNCRLGKAGRQLLKQNLALFIRYRVRNLNGARSLLPHFIRDLVEELVKLTGKADERDNFTERITRVITRNNNIAWAAVSGVHNGRFRRAQQSYTQLSDETLIGAATATGSLDVLRAMLKILPRSAMSKSDTFGLHPLAIAASEGYMDIVKAMVIYMMKQSGFGQYPLSSYSNWRWTEAVETCLGNNGKDPEALKLLLNVITRHYFFRKPQFKKWLSAAVDTAEAGIVLAVLPAGCNDPTECYCDGFARACVTRLWNIARLFIERGFIHPNQEFFVNREDGYECPLSWAAYHGGLGLVKFLLDRGADPNGTGGVKNKPMFRAMRHPKITKLLVQHGAEQNFSVHEVVRSSDSYQPKKLEVWKTTPVRTEIPSEKELLGDAPTLFPV